jgi:hypothetical protein
VHPDPADAERGRDLSARPAVLAAGSKPVDVGKLGIVRRLGTGARFSLGRLAGLRLGTPASLIAAYTVFWCTPTRSAISRAVRFSST